MMPVDCWCWVSANEHCRLQMMAYPALAIYYSLLTPGWNRFFQFFLVLLFAQFSIVFDRYSPINLVSFLCDVFVGDIFIFHSSVVDDDDGNDIDTDGNMYVQLTTTAMAQ